MTPEPRAQKNKGALKDGWFTAGMHLLKGGSHFPEYCRWHPDLRMVLVNKSKAAVCRVCESPSHFDS